MSTEPTVREWLEGFARLFPNERSPATAKHDAYMLAPFVARHGSTKLAGVTPLMAQQWALKNPGQVRYLRYAWERALAMQLVTVNPWRLVELPRRKAPPRAAPTPKELDVSLSDARARGGWWLEFADLVEFAAFTGARLGGVSTLQRRDVNLENRRAVLTEKGDKTRAVVLAGRAFEAVRRQLERSPYRIEGSLVWTTAHRRPHTRESIGRAWREIRGGFPGGFHALKHFAGTWLAAQGVDERDIAIQLGHYDAAGRPYVRLVRRVYVHPDHSEALERLERQLAGTPCEPSG